jgi:hypothetical protein
MRIHPVTLLIGLLCLAAAGCTTTSPGEATSMSTFGVSTADSTSTPSDEGDLPAHGAPKVSDPLDTNRFQDEPCALLTASQAQDELNLPPSGKPEGLALGKGCNWFNRDTRGEVTLGLLTGNPNGLSAAYEANQRGDYAYFTELPPVDGHPVVASDVVDRRSSGACIVDVGVTDTLLLNVALSLSQSKVEMKDPCEVAAQVAGLALRTMKEAA